MVTRINTGKNIRGALNYNEQKLTQGTATFMMAGNYPKDIGELSYEEKLQVLQHQAALNERAKTNCVHISLNFESNEKISDNKMQDIARDYMTQIGLGEQPYLVYRHTDAAHPHIHIVTTNIDHNGTRIDLHNLGRGKSEQAREAIEQKYGLVKAKGRGNNQQIKEELASLKPGDVVRANYGKEETKKAITQIVTLALQKFNVTSLPELNAVLNQFGVIADRGHENSNTYKNNGLLYRILDEKGNHIGVPIKASKIYNQPTMKRLEERFKQNQEKRPILKEKLKIHLNNVLRAYPSLSKETFVKELSKNNVQVVFRENKDGITYGVTYVDHQNRSVFNGSELGKAYSAKALAERLKDKGQSNKINQGKSLPTQRVTNYKDNNTRETSPAQLQGTSFLEISLTKNVSEAAPIIPRKKKKKKGQHQEMQQTI